MKFREIFEIDSKINQEISWWGISGNGIEILDEFYSFIKERYSIIADKESFLESDVPEDVRDAFEPVYELYVKSQEFKGKTI